MNEDFRDECLEMIENVDGVLFSSIVLTENPDSILPSEALAFISLCLVQEVTEVIESGRSRGGSTWVLGEQQEYFEVTSIEHDPKTECDQRLLEEFPNLELHQGDGVILVPKLVAERQKDQRLAILLDGPKGERAFEVAKEVLDQVVFVAIHDASRRRQGSDGTEPNPIREVLDTSGLSVWYTDDEFFLDDHGDMDEGRWKGKEYGSREELTATGFTLAIIAGGLW